MTREVQIGLGVGGLILILLGVWVLRPAPPAPAVAQEAPSPAPIVKRLATVPVAEPGPQVITERVPDALGAPSTVEASEASWAWEDDKVARADRVVTAASAEMGLTETEATEVRAALIAFIEGRASRWRAMKGQEKVDTAEMIAQTRASRQALTDALTKAIGAKRTARVLELFRDPATRF